MHFKLTIVIASVVIVSTFVIALTVGGDSLTGRLIVKLEKDNRLMKLAGADGRSAEFYVSDKYWVHSVTVSPHGDYAAFIEEAGPRYTDTGSAAHPKIALVVLDEDGRIVARANTDVKMYDWSPDGRRLALVTFAPCDPDYEFKCPTGAWIFDIEQSDITKITDTAYAIRWAEHDSLVYIKSSDGVLSYNPVARTMSKTAYLDIDFSPDGEYYLSHPGFERDSVIQLYETGTNKNVAGLLPQDTGNIVGWAFNVGHFLHFVNVVEELETAGTGPIKVIKGRKVKTAVNTIYEPGGRLVVMTFEGTISPWCGDGSTLIIERDGKLVLVEIP